MRPSATAASAFPLRDGLGTRVGAEPATAAVPVNMALVAPRASLFCPPSTRDVKAAAAPVAARLDRYACDCAASVGAAMATDVGGGLTGLNCVAVLAVLGPRVPGGVGGA